MKYYASVSRPTADIKRGDYKEAVLEAIVPISLAVSLIIACLLTTRPFWTDEVITWKIVSDPSFQHMWHGLLNGTDGAYPLFYLLLRPWTVVFGKGQIALRLFSSAGFCVSIAVVWWLLRRAYRFAAAAFGSIVAFATSDVVLYQNAGARSYGLFCATFSIAVLATVLIDEVPTPRRFLGNVLAQGILVYSHPFGILYSALILLALAMFDCVRGRLRWKVYASFVLAWSALLPWLPVIRVVSKIGVPHFWIPRPGVGTLISVYLCGSVGPFLGLAFISYLLTLDASTGATEVPEIIRMRRGIVGAIAYATLVAPMLVFITSQCATPLFVPRYFMPVTVAAGIVFTQLAGQALGDRPFSHLSVRLMCGVLLFVVLLYPVGYAILEAGSRSCAILRVEPVVPRDMPVVMESGSQFFSVSYYTSRADRPYYYLLDWPVAVDMRAPIARVSFDNTFRILQHNGHWADRILESQDFLCVYQRFMVFHVPGQRWFDERIVENSAYKTTLLNSVDGPDEDQGSLILVERVGRSNCGATRRE
jgi:hypothetical protein